MLASMRQAQELGTPKMRDLMKRCATNQSNSHQNFKKIYCKASQGVISNSMKSKRETLLALPISRIQRQLNCFPKAVIT